MEWQDQAIVLGARKHGEGHAVLTVLTKENGLASGYVRGGSSRRQRPVLQPGNQVQVTWRGRLEEHLGSFRAELVKSLAPGLFSSPDRLAALNATTALLMAALPEREAADEIYNETLVFLTLLTGEAAKPEWGAELVHLECLLLKLSGFGLDLEKCAGTGETQNLTYVSPNTGRAVSREAGAPYKEKLLILPSFLTNKEVPTEADILAGLRLTGHFISGHVLHGENRGVMTARDRLLSYFSGN